MEASKICSRTCPGNHHANWATYTDCRDCVFCCQAEVGCAGYWKNLAHQDCTYLVPMSHVPCPLELAPRGTEHHRCRFERTPTATARPHHHCAGPSARYLNILNYAELILKSLGCFFSHFLTFLDPLNVFCHRNRESDGNRVKHRCSQRGLCGICHEGCRSMWTLPISPYPDKHRTLRRPVLYFNTLLCVNRGVRFQSKIAQKNLKKPLDTFWKIASSNPSSQGQGSLECGSGFGFGVDKDTVTMVLKSSAPSAMSRQSPSCLHHCLSRLSRFSQLQPIWPQGVLHFFLQISLLHPSCEAAALVCCTWWINNWLSSQRSESCFEWNWYESIWINTYC